MEYKVVPFIATLNEQKKSNNAVSSQLERIIAHNTNKGWEYVSLENISTYVQGDSGCFGLGGKSGYMSSYQMVIFKKG